MYFPVCGVSEGWELLDACGKTFSVSKRIENREDYFPIKIYRNLPFPTCNDPAGVDAIENVRTAILKRASDFSYSSSEAICRTEFSQRLHEHAADAEM